VLRLAARAAGGVDDGVLRELASSLGADVPSLLAPGRVLMTGAGEHVDRLPDPDPFGLVIVPSDEALSTPAVYAEFDRRGGARGPTELEAHAQAARAGEPPPPVNDLQDAARALCVAIDPVLDAIERAGASVAMVAGSGPTVFGLFDDPERAQAAARTLDAAGDNRASTTLRATAAEPLR
jgi:4-diphosphocytidyl-2-C-methyl-D-erythritol kinase